MIDVESVARWPSPEFTCKQVGTFSAAPQDMEPWSGEQLTVKANAVGDFIELEIPAGDADPRQLILYATKAPDYGTLRFHVNGKASATQFDGYSQP